MISIAFPFSGLPDEVGLPLWAGLLILVLVGALLWLGAMARRLARTLASRERIDGLLSELAMRREQLRTMEAERSRFLAAFSHDLKQPMQAMTLYLGGLERTLSQDALNPSDKSKARESLLRIRQSMRYMTELFDGVLDVAKLDNEAMPVDTLQLPVVAFCERLVAEHRRIAEDLGLRLEICIPTDAEPLVITDPKLLERIVRNFISNAIRYTRTGGIRLRISVRDRVCRIAVTDTGPGIPASERKAIFEDFSRGGRVELTTQGSGLGLAIVRRLAARIGGRIAVRSHLGIGSMFSIDVPLATAPLSATAKAISHESEFVDRLLANLSAGAPPNTLLVCIGCAPDVGDAIAVLAAELDIEIFTAHSMDEALLRLAREGRVPDLVLLDMKPGGESPWLSIERVNDEFNTEMPMILCADESAWMDRPAADNRVRFLAKPYSITALRDAITQSLSLLT